MAKDQIHQQSFTEGVNTVLSPELMQPGQSKYWLNVRVLSSAKGNVGRVVNPLGNSLVQTPLPAGLNKCIGKAVDQENNVFYFFVYNSNGNHSIFQYNELENKISLLLQCGDDTAGVDILRFSLKHLILHADVIKGSLYWVDGNVTARKADIARLKDKSTVTGYGPIITEDMITASKVGPVYAPSAAYFSDPGKIGNQMYRHLFKFASRFIYRNGEISLWSDYSNVPLPKNESFKGLNSIPTDNNGITVTTETGSLDVARIEIAMQTGTMKFVSIATLDKRRLKIPDNSTYDYKFYNDGSYPVVDNEKIIKVQSYLPREPKCQAFIENALVYMNFKEGREKVDIDASASVEYKDLFLSSGVENKMNKPSIAQTDFDYTFVRDKGARRNSTVEITIGADVKKGNKFVLVGSNGESDYKVFTYTAELYDSANTVANRLKSLIITAFEDYRILQMSDNTTDGAGNVKWTMEIRGRLRENPTSFTGSVNEVPYQSLKDTGESIPNTKSGSSRKFAIVYEGSEDDKTGGYTSDDLIVKIKFITELGGHKVPVITITLNHKPPIWAKYFHIVRSKDLTYQNFIQLLIQKSIDVVTTVDGEYLDLVIGSLFTYQKMHENTHLTYEFKKGDRLRLIKRMSDNTLYPFFETEVLSYKNTTQEVINQKLTTDETDKVTIDGVASADYIGKSILFDSIEREIVGTDGPSVYVLDKEVPTTQVYTSFTVIDRRGIIRIKKPTGITVQDNSLIELYEPTLTGDTLGSKIFNFFNQKYPIINPGTEQRAHAGNEQNQNGSTPAKIKITDGDIYVRNRELPTNNAIPGTQVVVSSIEDAGYSDFYESSMNNNGKVTAEDQGEGEKHFGSRARWSNNYIEDTKINGLNDFDSSDRIDFNDRYGDVMLIKYFSKRLYCFKYLKVGWIPINAREMQLADGSSVLGASDKILNPMVPFSYEGGIGKHPESFIYNGSVMYFACAPNGTFCRLSQDGITPISVTHGYDNKAREILAKADDYDARLYGEFDDKNGEAIWSLESFNEYFVLSDFSDPNWITRGAEATEDDLFQIATEPAHGTVEFTNDYQVLYTPDADYVGADSFSYQLFIDGAWSTPTNVCINIPEREERPTAWRLKADTTTCEFTTEEVPDVPVTIEWQMLQDSSPYVNGDFNLKRNGVLIDKGNPSDLASFIIGDELTIQPFHYAPNFRWPDDAYFRIVVEDVDEAVLYSANGGTRDVSDVPGHTFTLTEEYYGIYCSTHSSDASLAPLGFDINNSTSFSGGVISIQSKDDTTGLTMLSISEDNNMGSYNVKNDAGTQTFRFQNTTGAAVTVRLRTVTSSSDETFGLAAGGIVNKTITKAGVIIDLT